MHAGSLREEQEALRRLQALRKADELARSQGLNSVAAPMPPAGEQPVTAKRGNLRKAKLTVDVTTNYKAMLELFQTKDELTAASTPQEVTVPFEMFVAVQERLAHYHGLYDELTETHKRTVVDLQENKKELENANRKVKEVLDVQTNLQARIEQLLLLNADVRRERDYHAQEIARLEDDMGRLRDRIAQQQQGLAAALHKVEELNVTLLVKEKGIESLVQTRAALQQANRELSNKVKVALREQAKAMVRGAVGTAKLRISRSAFHPDTDPAGETGQDESDPNAPPAMLARNGSGVLSAQLRQAETELEHYKELASLAAESKRTAVSSLITRLESTEKRAMHEADKASVAGTRKNGAPQDTQDIQDAKMITLAKAESKLAVLPKDFASTSFPNDSPFYSTWSQVSGAARAAVKSMSLTLETFDRFEATLGTSLSLRDLQDRWKRFMPTWRSECVAGMNSAFESLGVAYGSINKAERAAVAKILREVQMAEEERKVNVRSVAVQTNTYSIPLPNKASALADAVANMKQQAPSQVHTVNRAMQTEDWEPSPTVQARASTLSTVQDPMTRQMSTSVRVGAVSDAATAGVAAPTPSGLSSLQQAASPMSVTSMPSWIEPSETADSPRRQKSTVKKGSPSVQPSAESSPQPTKSTRKKVSKKKKSGSAAPTSGTAATGESESESGSEREDTNEPLPASAPVPSAAPAGLPPKSVSSRKPVIGDVGQLDAAAASVKRSSSNARIPEDEASSQKVLLDSSRNTNMEAARSANDIRAVFTPDTHRRIGTPRNNERQGGSRTTLLMSHEELESFTVVTAPQPPTVQVLPKQTVTVMTQTVVSGAPGVVTGPASDVPAPRPAVSTTSTAQSAPASPLLRKPTQDATTSPGGLNPTDSSHALTAVAPDVPATVIIEPEPILVEHQHSGATPEWCHNLLVPRQTLSEDDQALFTYLPEHWFAFHNLLHQFLAETRKRLRIMTPIADASVYIGDAHERSIADVHAALRFDVDALTALLTYWRAQDKRSKSEATRKLHEYHASVNNLRLHQLDVKCSTHAAFMTLNIADRDALQRYRVERSKRAEALVHQLTHPDENFSTSGVRLDQSSNDASGHHGMVSSAFTNALPSSRRSSVVVGHESSRPASTTDILTPTTNSLAPAVVLAARGSVAAPPLSTALPPIAVRRARAVQFGEEHITDLAAPQSPMITQLKAMPTVPQAASARRQSLSTGPFAVGGHSLHRTSISAGHIDLGVNGPQTAAKWGTATSISVSSLSRKQSEGSPLTARAVPRTGHRQSVARF